MKSEKYEEWFDVAFDRAVSSSSLTTEEDKKASWKKVQAKLQMDNRKRKRRRRMQLSGIVAASFVAGAFLFSPPGITKAVSPIVKTVVDMGNGVMGVVIRNGEVPPTVADPHTDTPANLYPDENIDFNEKLLSSEVMDSVSGPLNLDELKSKLTFALPNINQLGTDYTFESYTLSEPTSDNKRYDKVTLKYTDKNQHPLWIYLLNLRIYQSKVTHLSKDIEIFKVGQDDVYYQPGVHNELLGLQHALTIQVGSDLPKEELIRVYKLLVQEDE